MRSISTAALRVLVSFLSPAVPTVASLRVNYFAYQAISFPCFVLQHTNIDQFQMKPWSFHLLSKSFIAYLLSCLLERSLTIFAEDTEMSEVVERAAMLSPRKKFGWAISVCKLLFISCACYPLKKQSISYISVCWPSLLQVLSLELIIYGTKQFLGILSDQRTQKGHGSDE